MQHNPKTYNLQDLSTQNLPFLCHVGLVDLSFCPHVTLVGLFDGKSYMSRSFYSISSILWKVEDFPDILMGMLLYQQKRKPRPL